MNWPKKYKQYDPETEGYGNTKEWKRLFENRIDPDTARQILRADDPYLVLGVKRTSTKEEIQSVFRKLAKQWHPDRNPDNIEQATEMMKKLNAAYSLLMS